jgi:UDP-3-O-[3-hydroxymyristoyl] glucosamine N-acyltransferase
MGEVRRLKELAALVGGDLSGDGEIEIRAVTPIDEAGHGDITFITNPKYRRLLAKTKASAVIVSKEEEAPSTINLIRVEDPYLAFAKVLDIFKPVTTRYKGIHPKAEIHKNTVIGENTSIYPCVVVDDGARIGNRVVLYPGVYIGCNAAVEDDTVLYPNVTVREGCKIGRRVMVHANSVIGSDGFGYAREGDAHFKVPQIGIVVIEDDVEIGACVTIDRATFGRTVIRRGTKIDNIVQIAHNVDIGEDSIIVAQVGISGSTKVGKRVTLAGQVGVVGHIEIGDDVTVGAQSGVIGDLPSKAVFAGYPAILHSKWLRAQGVFVKLPEIRKKLMELEKRIKEIENATLEERKG